MSSEDDARLPDLPKPPRQNRFRFKTFAQRVAEVEVDVYRTLAPIKATPAGGCWLADALSRWRELNSASHFLQVAAALQPLCQTLPQLLHHKEEVLGTLLGALVPAARLSLPALLDLLAQLARDLQQEFLPMLPRAVAKIAALLEGGADRDPDSLEPIFSCLSHVCKFLARPLAVDLAAALRATAPLRYFRAPYVRQFAAQAVGFLFRSAPSAAALRAGVRALLAEQAARPSEERTDGAGLLLAESVLGVSHGLHSRAAQVLALMMQEDLIQAGELRAKGATAAAADGAEAAPPKRAGGPAVSQEELRARAAAVAAVALDRLLNHVRRGRAPELWQALLAEASRRLAVLEAAAGGAQAKAAAADAAALPPAAVAAGRSLARALLLVAQAVSYYRGSRVEGYRPLLDLMGRLAQLGVTWAPALAAAPTSAGPLVAVEDESEPMLVVSLSGAVLELGRAVVYGHLKVAGASEGPAALARVAPAWAPLFARPPAAELLPFARALMTPPAGVDVARPFAQHLLGRLGRIVMEADQQQQQQRREREAALLLMVDLCELLQPHGAAAAGLPLLLSAQTNGVRLAAHVRALLTGWSAVAAGGKGATHDSVAACSEAWAALRLLPHACESPAQAVAACDAVLSAAADGVKQLAAAGGSAAARRSLMLLHAAASEQLVDLLQQQPWRGHGADGRLAAAAEAALQWALDSSIACDSGGADDAATEPPLKRQAKERTPKQQLHQPAAAASAADAHGGGGRGVWQPGTDARADYVSLRAAGSLMEALRRRAVGEAGPAAAAAAAAADQRQASALLSQARLRELVPRLAPLLAHPSQPLRAAVLRLLCCFEQPRLEAVAPDPKDPAASLERERQASGRSSAPLEPFCDLLEVLHNINSQPPGMEAGRKWPVAISRLKTHLEYARIPDFLIPCFAYGLVGVLHIRFSPLWQPAAEALAACLQYADEASWPVVRALLTGAQQQLLAGDVEPGGSGGAGGPRGKGKGKGARGGKKGGRPGAKRGHHQGAQPNPSAGGGGDHEGGGDDFGSDAESEEGDDGAAAPVGTLAGAPLELARDRFLRLLAAGTPQAAGGVTDAQNRLSHALRAMAAAPHERVEAHSRDWAGLFLDYTAARGSHFDDGDADAVQAAVAAARSGVNAATAAAAPSEPQQQQPTVGGKRGRPAAAGAVAGAATAERRVSVLSVIGGRTWRAGLLDWLKLLAGLKGAKGLHRSEELKQAVASHLLEADGTVQAAALRCLRPYKLRWLTHGDVVERLARLADDKSLREELALFPVAPDAEGAVPREHRAGLMPLLVRVLFPKMRKRSGRLGGRGAPGSARAAILNALSGLQPDEMRPLLELLLEPMAVAFVQPPQQQRPNDPQQQQALKLAAQLDSARLVAPPWWSGPLLACGLDWWLEAVDGAALAALPPRRHIGFLNAFEDLLLHLGHKLEPMLSPLLAITLRLLGAACDAVAAEQQQQQAQAGAAAGHAACNDDDAMAVDSQEGRAAAPGGHRQPQAGADAHGGGPLANGVHVGAANGVDGSDSDAEEQLQKAAAAGAAGGKAGGEHDESGDEDSDEDEEGGSGGGGGDAAARRAEQLRLRYREVRGGSLRLLAQVWLRFPASPSCDYNHAWPLFLPAVQPLLARLDLEAAAQKEPPLLECVLALCLSPGLARVLGDAHSLPDATMPLLASAQQQLQLRPAAIDGDAVPGAAEAAARQRLAAAATSLPEEAWQASRCGSRLMRAAVGVLRSGRCSEAVRRTLLDALEALLGCGDDVVSGVLLPLMDELLAGLNDVIAAAWQSKGARRGKGVRRAVAGGGGGSAHRELAILERLGGYVASKVLAQRLGDALVALLAMAGARGGRQRGGGSRLDEAGISRALGALAALLGRLSPGGDLPESVAESYWEAISGWAIRLRSRDARSALASALAATARLLPDMALPAQLFADLNAWSPAQLDEPDYERRLQAYTRLLPEQWARLSRLQALPLAHQALHDLRNTAGDMALRQAASTAMARLVEAMASLDAAAAAAAATAAGGDATAAPEDAPNSLLRLAGRVLYPQARSQLGAAHLAVRQEHVGLVRALAAALPGRFPELALLLSRDDPEVDFYNNIAHLQSHRRTRALHRLAKHIKTHCAPPAAAAAGQPPQQPDARQRLLLRALMDVAFPLLQQFIEEGAGLGPKDTGRAHERKQTDLDKEANVTDAAIGALGALAAAAPWPCYEQILFTLLKLLKQRRGGVPSKPVVRSVCAIIDAFHFPLPAGGNETLPPLPMPAPAAPVPMPSAAPAGAAAELAAAADAPPTGKEQAAADGAAPPEEGDDEEEDGSEAGSEEEGGANKGAKGAGDEADDDDGIEEDPAVSAALRAARWARYREEEAAAVQRVLQRRVLPTLHGLLVDKAGEAARAPVALALVKLLKLLPPAAERAELPRTLQSVANLLRARLQRVRDDARAVFVSMMAELGPRYVPYACHVLRAALPDKGFTAHVMGFTLHAVLEAVVKVAHGEKASAAAAAATADKDEAALEAAAADAAQHYGGQLAAALQRRQQEAEAQQQEQGGAAGDAAAAAAVDNAMSVSDDEAVGGGADDEEEAVGLLDDSLELCLPLIEADLFGEVSEAKEALVFSAQYKEAKRCRANEAYMLLAQSVTFDTCARLLLGPVTGRLAQAGQPKVRGKLTQLLAFAARGIRSNPTARPQALMVFVVSELRRCLEREEAARARAKEEAGPAHSQAAGREATAGAGGGSAASRRDRVLKPGSVVSYGKSREEVHDAAEALDERAALHEYLLMEFCLTLLHTGIRRGVLAGAARSPALLGLLDPCLTLLVRALRSRHTGCVSLALRCLAHLVSLPLPGLADACGDAGRAVLSLLRKVPNVRHPIAQECFRLLGALLRDCAAYQPTTAQVRFLLRWGFEDLGEAGSQPAAFGLLRALLGRRLVVPEVYDVMDRVQQVMVRSQSAPVRQSCSVALLQFLLDFPLGPQRLAQHLQFLLANLAYEYESGRLAVLDMLGQVVAKFPQEVLQAQAELLLLPLVARLVNDPSPKARAAAAGVVRALLGRLAPQQLDDAASFCLAWLQQGTQAGSGKATGQGSGKGALRRAAAQTLALVAEVEGARFARRLPELAPPLLSVLERQADAAEAGADQPEPSTAGGDEAGDAAGEAQCPGWQEAYAVLLLLEKVAGQQAGGPAALGWEGPLGPAGAESLWRAICRLLLARHMWVRKVAARLVGGALASPQLSRGLLAAPEGATAAAAAAAGVSSRAGQLAFSFYLQLECEAAGQDEAAGLQAVKCLVALAPRLEDEAPPEREQGDGDAGDGGSKRQRQPEAEDQGGEDDEEAEDDAAGGGVSMGEQMRRGTLTLRGLVRRMARLADDGRWVRQRQRACALRWTAAAASALGTTRVTPHLPILLRPLFRISEAATAASASGAGSGPTVPDEVRELAEEVMAHLRELVGSDALLGAYNAAREHVRRTRSQRRKRQAVRGMVDPAAAAAARLKHSARKAAGRKRKLELLKRGEGRRRGGERAAGARGKRGGGFGGGKRARQD